MDRDDVTSAGLTAIGILAGAVAEAVALGGRLVAAGLGTLENALRGGEESADLGTRRRSSPSTARSKEDPDEDADEDGGEGFARLSQPAFEPADGITPPARPARSAIRQSSAGATARTGPGPRPAKRATAKSLPPNLRPVEPREPAPEPAPVKAAAGAADAAGVTPAKGAKATTNKATATKATATKATAKRATAKKATAKKASPSTRAAKKAPAEPAAATHSAESAHTRPEGAPDAGEGPVQNP